MLPQHFLDYTAASGPSLFGPSSGLSAQPLSFSSSATVNTDPNSPELFRQNIKVAMQYVQIIERLARSSLAGIEQAFHAAPSSSPSQAVEDLAALRHYLELFTDFLTQSGVGALPMPPALLQKNGANPGSAPAPVQIPNESELFTHATVAVNELYAQQKQIKENNGVVASLLGASTAMSSSGSGHHASQEGPRR